MSVTLSATVHEAVAAPRVEILEEEAAVEAEQSDVRQRQRTYDHAIREFVAWYSLGTPRRVSCPAGSSRRTVRRSPSQTYVSSIYMSVEVTVAKEGDAGRKVTALCRAKGSPIRVNQHGPAHKRRIVAGRSALASLDTKADAPAATSASLTSGSLIAENTTTFIAGFIPVS